MGEYVASVSTIKLGCPLMGIVISPMGLVVFMDTEEKVCQKIILGHTESYT